MIEKHKKDDLEQQIKQMKPIEYDNFTISQMRFFCSYLSKIDPKDISSRNVVFTIDEFSQLLDLEDTDENTIFGEVEKLLKKIITVKNDKNGFDSFQFFKKCSMYKKNGGQYLSIDAHDNALPLFFAFKEKLFSNNVLNYSNEIYLEKLSLEINSNS